MKALNPIFVIEAVAFCYRVFGREAAKRMITIPRGWCIARSKAKGDDPSELIAKRDRWVESTLELAEEIAGLDND